jgi:uncharacterized protein (TIGR02118 family)
MRAGQNRDDGTAPIGQSPPAQTGEVVMPATLTVAYPVETPEFDHAYHATTHLPLVLEVFRPLGMEDATVSRGVAGPQGGPAPWHAVATLIFPDLETLQAALREGERVLADIPHFYTGRPVMTIGESLV